MSDKKIKVRIRAKQVVEYDQEVEMSKPEYDTLMDADDTDISRRENSKAFSILESYITMTEILDAEDEFTDVEIIKLKS